MSPAQGSWLTGQYEWELSLSLLGYGVLVRAHCCFGSRIFLSSSGVLALAGGPWSGEGGISIISMGCLNSDLTFSCSAFLGLFLSPSCQTSSCSRAARKEIQPDSELRRKRLVSSVPGAPRKDPHRAPQEKRPRACSKATTSKGRLLL